MELAAKGEESRRTAPITPTLGARTPLARPVGVIEDVRETFLAPVAFRGSSKEGYGKDESIPEQRT